MPDNKGMRRFGFVNSFKRKAIGFTLAELLIALLVLGVIATFTIPKILQNQQDQRKKSIYRETIAALSSILYAGVLDKTLDKNNFEIYFPDHMNMLKMCTVDPVAEGCWADSGTYPTSLSPFTNTAFVMHNGMAVSMGVPEDRGGGEVASFIFLDWNNVEPPNNANDQMAVCLSFGTATFNNGVSNWGIIPPGKLIPCNNLVWSVALYEEIFSN